MKLNLKTIVLFTVMLGVCFTWPGVFAAVPQHVEKTVALMRSGRYLDAVGELDGLLADDAGQALLLRLKGISLMELDRSAEALEVLKKAVQADPDSLACRFYLAQALAYNGDIARALSGLRAVQADAPDSLYAEHAATAIPRLENMLTLDRIPEKPRRWSLSLRAAGEYDDNVAARSSGVPYDGEDGSWRGVVSAYTEFRAMDQTIDQLPLTAGIYASGYASFHDESVYRDYDVRVGSAALFVRRFGTLGLPYSLDVTVGYTDVDLGDVSYSRTLDAVAGLDIQWARWAVLTPRLMWASKDFEDDTTMPELYSRDGTENAVGMDQYFYLFRHALILGAGYEYRRVEAEGDLFELTSHNAHVAASLRLPLKLCMGTRLSYSEENYVEYTPDPRRVDDCWNVHTTLSRPLFWNGLTAEISHTYDTSKSTVTFAGYTRHVTGISLRATY